MVRYTPPLVPGEPVPSYESYFYGLFALSAIVLLLFLVQAWGLYGLAKKQGVKNAWLAWIPGVDLWVLGDLTEDKKLRLPLLLLGILAVLLPILIFWGFFGFCLVLNGFVMQDIYENMAIYLFMFIGGLVMMGILLLPLLVLMVLRTVQLNRVWERIVPETADRYRLLSIFQLPIPILMAICNQRAQ